MAENKQKIKLAMPSKKPLLSAAGQKRLLVVIIGDGWYTQLDKSGFIYPNL